MNRHLMTALLAFGLVSAALPDPTPALDRLLERLRTEHRHAVTEPSGGTTGKPRIDLRALIGVGRDKLVSSLGTADFCASPEEAECRKSTRLAYFFFPREKTPIRDLGDGSVEVAVTAGGGWALELHLTRDAVDHASWVEQK